MLKVEDLIHLLEKCPKDFHVAVASEEGGGSFCADKVFVEVEEDTVVITTGAFDILAQSPVRK